VDESFSIRPATLADIDDIARHRALMFRDMGAVTAGLVDQLIEMTRTRLLDAMPRGEYIGWIASPHADTDSVVAGAGVQVRQVLPFPRVWPDGRADVADGRQGIVINVYTEPAFRRRGAARALMHALLAWARTARLDSLVLHAAPDGRPLYEALGFVATNEMRLGG
jgi:GNAT superfamily N-acetyltransferase